MDKIWISWIFSSSDNEDFFSAIVKIRNFQKCITSNTRPLTATDMDQVGTIVYLIYKAAHWFKIIIY
jgi:hypothetical protein